MAQEKKKDESYHNHNFATTITAALSSSQHPLYMVVISTTSYTRRNSRSLAIQINLKILPEEMPIDEKEEVEDNRQSVHLPHQ